MIDQILLHGSKPWIAGLYSLSSIRLLPELLIINIGFRDTLWVDIHGLIVEMNMLEPARDFPQKIYFVVDENILKHFPIKNKFVKELTLRIF